MSLDPRMNYCGSGFRGKETVEIGEKRSERGGPVEGGGLELD